MEPNDHIKCYLCHGDKFTVKEYNADYHKINHDHIKCYLCNKEFTDKKYAINHQKINHKQSFAGCGCHYVYDCHFCQEELTDCKCHGVDECHHCGKTISYLSALADLKVFGRYGPSKFQIFLNDPLNNIKCFPCGKEFTDEISAINHRANTHKIGNRERNEECLNCKERFPNIDLLTEHFNTIHSEASDTTNILE